jgi:hypothetical protein
MELYFDANAAIGYPAGTCAANTLNTYGGAGGCNATTNAAADLGVLVPTYVGGLPLDPVNTAGGAAIWGTHHIYAYGAGSGPAGTVVNCSVLGANLPCTHYFLAVDLEDPANTALSNSNHSATAGFNGVNGIDCSQSPAAGQWYTYCVGA